MAKGIRSIEFNFVPFPAEVWDEGVFLTLCEFRLLGYLCKQLRFGESLKPLSDDELLNGVLKNGEREDKGCGLSRNGIKQARESLVARNWIEAQNVSEDSTRPKWAYRLILKKRDVTDRQLVSQRDSAVSRFDSAVSQRDTALKEERKSFKKNHTEGAALSQSERDTIDWKRLSQKLNQYAPQVGMQAESGEQYISRVRQAAHDSGVSLSRAQELLKQFFPDDPVIDQIIPKPQEIHV